jgi:hypothetical protein
MCSGLPIIASPSGGMAEMLRDGETGWIADSAGSDGLAAALRRALSTKPERVAEMGRQASSEIRQLCGNKKIVEDHRTFRSRVARDGPKRSLRLPVNLPWSGTPLTGASARRVTAVGSQKGMAVVVNGLGREEILDECLKSIERQSRPPSAVVLVCDRAQPEGETPVVQGARRLGWRICEGPGRSDSAAKNAGIEAVLAAGSDPIAFVFLDAADRLLPGFVETCESVLQRCPEVGLVSSWAEITGDGGRVVVNPCPAFPYQILSDDTVPVTAIRTQALREAGGFRTELSSGFERWDLVNAVMASGWTVVTAPVLLSERVESDPDPGRAPVLTRGGRMRSMVLARFPEVVTRYSQELVRLLELRIALSEWRAHQSEERLRLAASRPWQAAVSEAAGIGRPADIIRWRFSHQIALAWHAVRHPRRAIRFVVRQVRRGLNPFWIRIRGTLIGRDR